MTNMDAEALERSIQSIEQQYAVRVTIIDREGFFHDHSGKALFSRQRHSHQFNAVCKKQFSQRCVNHCRYSMNAVGEKKRAAFEHVCWKGVREMAVPMFLNGNHLGTCYLGQWQTHKKSEDPARNPEFKKPFLQSYTALPKRDAKRIQELYPIAEFLAQSLVLHVQQLKSIDPQMPPRQQEIMDFIQQSAGTDLNLESLARHLSLSTSRCSHAVKESCKQSLHQLILSERIKRASQLLCNSDRSAQEIADIVGFSDQYYFNKAFKSAVGIPPGLYRKQNRQ